MHATPFHWPKYLGDRCIKLHMWRVGVAILHCSKKIISFLSGRIKAMEERPVLKTLAPNKSAAQLSQPSPRTDYPGPRPQDPLKLPVLRRKRTQVAIACATCRRKKAKVNRALIQEKTELKKSQREKAHIVTVRRPAAFLQELREERRPLRIRRRPGHNAFNIHPPKA